MKLLKYGLMAIYAVVGVAAIFFVVPQTGWKALSVQTGSMNPAIPKGSLVIIHNEALSKIKPGDVATYRSPVNPKVTITHRVAKVGNSDGVPIFTFKGDANSIADPNVVGGSIQGKVHAHLPYVGTIADWLRTPVGLAVVVLLPGLIIIGGELMLMVRRLQEVTAQEISEQSRKMEARRAQIHRPVAARPDLRQPGRPRPIIRLITMLALPAILLGTGVTHALISSSVKLTNNQIGVATTPTPPPSGGNTCLQTSSGTISNTGPGSTNTISNSSTCTINSSTTNSTTVTNTSSQSGTTGSATSSGNTSGGTATSGSVQNTSGTQTTTSGQ